MANDYGVGPNGLPVQAETVDTTSPCPQGQKRNAVGVCVKEGDYDSSGTGPSSNGNTGVAGPAAKTPGYDPEQFRQRWLAAGIKDPNAIQKWFDDNADVTQGIKLTGDKATLPQQYHKYTTVDLMGNSKDSDPTNNSTTFGSYGAGSKPKVTTPPGGGNKPGPDMRCMAQCVPPLVLDANCKCTNPNAGGTPKPGTGTAPKSTFAPKNPLSAYQFQFDKFTPTTPLKPFDFTADYTASQFGGSQFDRQGTRERTGQLIDQMLSETSLNPAVVAQMKEAQKGSMVTMANQQKQVSQQDAARRGVRPNSNALIDAALMGNLSSAYRDIDIQKATQDRADQMGAVDASRGFQNDLVSQFLALEEPKFREYTADRDRESLQAGENARVQGSEFDRWLGEQGMNLTMQDRQAQENARVQMGEFSQWAAKEGINLDYMRLAQDESQFARNLQLLIARFLAEK